VLTSTVGGKTQPLIEESVRFSVTGPAGAKDVFVTTDYLGRATFPPPGIPSGTYTVNAVHFDGNATYSASALNLAGSVPVYNFTGFSRQSTIRQR